MYLKKLVTFMFLFFTLLSFAQQTDYHSKFRFDLHGGLGFSLTKTPEISNDDPNHNAYTDYFDQLERINNFQFASYYHLSGGSYLGMKYHFLNSSASVTNVKFFEYDDSGLPVVLIGDMSEKQYVNYIGLSYLYEEWLDMRDKWLFSSSGTVGYASYRSEERLMMYNYLATGQNIGFGFDLALDCFLTKQLSVGFKTGLFSVRFLNLKLTDGVETQEIELESENSINLSNINFSLGVSYHL